MRTDSDLVSLNGRESKRSPASAVADLGIRERTVKLHRTNITTKLQVHSVAELTRLVLEAGVFPSVTSNQLRVISKQ